MNISPNAGANEQQDMTAILKRIAKLERQNKRLKQIGTAVVFLGAAFLFMGQTKQSATSWDRQSLRVQKIQANRIELVTREGQRRAEMYTDSLGGSEPTMYDSNEQPRLHISGFTGSILLGDLKTSKSGDVILSSPPGPGEQRMMLSSASLILIGSGSTAALSVAEPPFPGAALSLNSDSPNLMVGRANAYHTEIGSTDLVTPATGTKTKTSAASVVLFNDKGSVIWSAPR